MPRRKTALKLTPAVPAEPKRLLGYMRVSTPDQDPALQLAALEKEGCEEVFRDVASGAKTDRPGLAELLEVLEEGDVLVVWKLDRLGRSLPHLVQVVGALRAKGVGLRSMTESLDTTTAGGQLVFHIFAALADFERELIRERTRAGLEAARARGRKGGRKKVVTSEKLQKARELVESGLTVREAAARVKASKSALYDAFRSR